MRRTGVVWPAIVLMGLWLGATAVLHDDFGATWDDPLHAQVGARALAYFVAGSPVVSAGDYWEVPYYNPLHDLVPALLHSSHDAALYDLRHLWNAFFATTLIPGLFLLCRRTLSPWLAPFAVVALVAQPRFLGDVFLNSKDGSFAVAVVWFNVALLTLVRHGLARPVDFVGFGIALGLALAERPGGLPLLLVQALLAILGGDVLRRQPRPAMARVFLPSFLMANVLAWVIMVLPWPAAHAEPLAHPVRVMSIAARFYAEYPVLYEGAVRSSRGLPRSYVPLMLLRTTPLTVLLFALGGLAASLHAALRLPASRRATLLLVVGTWLFVPILGALVARPNVFDGIRHFLFVLPAVALLAATGAVICASALARWMPRWRWLAFASVAVTLASPLTASVRLHPYEYVFFNALAGGLDRAALRFDTDYFATAYREAMNFVAAQAAGEPSRRFRVVVGGWGFVVASAAIYAPPNVTVELYRPEDPAGPLLPDDIDFYVGTTRAGLAEQPFPAAPVAYRVERDGATLAVVRGHASTGIGG